MKKENSNKFSIAQRLKSFGFAINGIIETAKEQHNFWIHCLAAVLVVVLGFLVNISPAEWLFIVFAIGFVFAAEIFNSAIEKMVDHISPEFDKNVGLVKDMAAGAVLISAITAAIVGIIIFVPRILQLL